MAHYVWRKGEGLVPLSAGRSEGRGELILDSPYDGLRATDGTDISSKRKYQAYMKANGLTHASDYDKPGGVWDRAAERRAAEAAGEQRDPQLRRDVEAAYRKVAQGYKPAPRPSADRGPDGDPYPVVEKLLFRR